MRSRNRWILLAALIVAGLIVGGVVLFREHASTAALTASASGSRAPELDAAQAVSQRVATDSIPPPSRQQTRIRIIEFGTNAPIPAALIRIEPAHNDDVQLVTDDQGLAHCDTALLEESWIEIRAPHYSSVRNPIPVLPTGDLEFALFGTGDLLVHVRDELGAPMPQTILLPELIDTRLSQAQHDAIVAGWPDWFSPKTKPWTDEAGDRRIDDLPRGYKLSVTALNTRVEVTLDRTTPLTEVTIVVPMNRCIHGRLVWEDGTPVTDRLGIESFVVGQPLGSWSRTSSDADGRFELCRLPKGRVNWQVQYVGESLRCLPAGFGVIDPVSRIGVVDLGDIVLHRALECHGRVRFADAPSDYDYWNVQLRVWQLGRNLGESWTVHHDGTFWARIPPGPATLSVILGWKAAAMVQVVSPFDGLVIDLDEYVGTLRIDNVPIPRRTELVLFLHDEPAVWSVRHPEGERSRPAYMNISDADVRWCDASLCIKDVTPGETDVFATDKMDTWFLGHTLVVAGHEAVIDAGLVQPGRIRVGVHDSAGKPVEGLEVEAALSAGLIAQLPVQRATTNADGEALLENMAAARWLVYPRGHGEFGDDALRVDLVSGATVSIEMVVSNAGSVSGTLTYGKAPAPGVAVYLVFGEPGQGAWHAWLGPSTSDPDGKYRFDHVLAGRYTLVCSREAPGSPPVRTTSRVIDVSSDVATVCDVDLDGSYRRLVFLRDGRAWDGVDAGWVYTPDGMHSLEPRPEFEGALGASIRSGPCVFVITSMDFAVPDRTLDSQEMYFVHVPAIDTSQAPITVDVRGGRIDVHLSGEGTQFPVAHVRSIDGCAVMGPFPSRERCVHVDAAGIRSFTHLPVGATVVLQPDHNISGGAVELEVHVVNEGTIDVTWPPH